MTRVLCVRLDCLGDVLLAGPAVRAVAASGAEVVLLAGPRGAGAARLLPGVSEVRVWCCPWIDPEPRPVERGDIADIVAWARAADFDAALIFTSYHQSPLPTALMLRLAGVPWVGAISDDYPGALLDLRHRVDGDPPEAERALSLAAAAGYRPPSGDAGDLRVRRPLPESIVEGDGYVVLHPGTSVPARAWPIERFAATARLLQADGLRVVVTGSPAETALTAGVAAGGATDLGGRTTLTQLAAVLEGADAVVVANTGPAHLAAAVGTPVVSLFAPTVPAARWAPYGVPTVVLGDQGAPCRDSRATTCPVHGHPCLTSVTAGDVVEAVRRLTPLEPGRLCPAEGARQ